MIDNTICPKCGQNRKRILSYTTKVTYDKFCNPCFNEIDLEKRLEKNSLLKEKLKEDLLKTTDRKCLECKKLFTTKNRRQSYCQNPCVSKYTLADREKRGKSPAEIWVNKKEVIRKKPDNEAVAYSFFRKKYGPGKQFRACRG